MIESKVSVSGEWSKREGEKGEDLQRCVRKLVENMHILIILMVTIVLEKLIKLYALRSLLLVIPHKSCLKNYSLQEEAQLAKRIEIKDLGAEWFITGNIEIS